MNIEITADTTAIISAIAAIITTFLTGWYVYITRKTFLEIKKQTDNQIRAHLLVAALVKSNLETENSKFSNLRDSWNETISAQLPDATQLNEGLIIELHNRGKTDICTWSINIDLQIEVGNYLSMKHIGNARTIINIESTGSQHFIKPSESIKIDIGNFGLIPKAIINWTIKYSDLLGSEYNTFSGDSCYFYENKLIFDYKAIKKNSFLRKICGLVQALEASPKHDTGLFQYVYRF